MTRLLIPLFLVVFSFNLKAQEYASVGDNSEYEKERINLIEKDIKKLDRSIKHAQKSLQKGDTEKRVAERELQLLRERQANNRELNRELLNSMRGYSLEALEDKIQLLEKDHSQLGRENSRKSKSIVRKRAQIEKLEQEIYVLEGGIEANENRMEIKMEEVRETREIIVENALESKTERLEQLNKDYDKLMHDEEKLRMKIGKIEDEIIRSQSDVQISVSQKTYLQKEEKDLRKNINSTKEVSRSY